MESLALTHVLNLESDDRRPHISSPSAFQDKYVKITSLWIVTNQFNLFAYTRAKTALLSVLISSGIIRSPDWEPLQNVKRLSNQISTKFLHVQAAHWRYVPKEASPDLAFANLCDLPFTDPIQSNPPTPQSYAIRVEQVWDQAWPASLARQNRLPRNWEIPWLCRSALPTRDLVCPLYQT